MSRTLVIGYGNPLRGDDGLGPAAVQKLTEIYSRQKSPPVFMTCHQLTPELSQTLSEFDLVIFIDSKIGKNPGEILVREIRPEKDKEMPGALTHQVSPEGLLIQSEILFGRKPRAYAGSIEGQDFGYQEKLSKEVEKKIPELIKKMRDLIDE